MRKISVILAAVLVFAMLFSVAGCSKKADNSIAGVWEYSDEEAGMSTVYDLKDDGTGTQTITVGDSEVVYELKYEVKDGHFLVTYVNNELFSEEDVFDSEFAFQDDNTILMKDSLGEELTFVRK